MFRQFLEGEGKFDLHKYEESGFTTIYKKIKIDTTAENAEVINAMTRILYRIFERAAKEERTSIVGYNGQLLYQFGAYETDLELMLEDYFPNGSLKEEPQHCKDDEEKMFLLRRVGLDLMTIGRLEEAQNMYEKSYNIAIRNKKWQMDAAKTLQLQSELYIFTRESSKKAWTKLIVQFCLIWSL